MTKKSDSLSGYNKSDCNVLDQKVLFQGYFRMDKYTVEYKKFDGTKSEAVEREIFERGCAAAVIPYDPITNKVVLIEQFRVGAINGKKSPWLVEIVAGIIDEGEDSEKTVVRELQEEAGLDCKNLKFINNFFTSPGGSTEEIDLYVAQVDSTKAQGSHGLESENEDIRVFSLDVEEAYELVKKGIICNSIAIIAIQYLMLHAKELIKEWSL